MILNYLNSNELWFICQEKDVSKKYYKIEILITLNKIMTFIEIIKEAIFKLSYKITEIEFINIVEELDIIYGKCNN